MLGTSFTDEILMGGEMVGMKEVKKIVKEVDRKLLLSRCRGKLHQWERMEDGCGYGMRR